MRHRNGRESIYAHNRFFSAILFTNVGHSLTINETLIDRAESLAINELSEFTPNLSEYNRGFNDVLNEFDEIPITEEHFDEVVSLFHLRAFENSKGAMDYSKGKHAAYTLLYVTSIRTRYGAEVMSRQKAAEKHVLLDTLKSRIDQILAEKTVNLPEEFSGFVEKVKQEIRLQFDRDKRSLIDPTFITAPVQISADDVDAIADEFNKACDELLDPSMGPTELIEHGHKAFMGFQSNSYERQLPARILALRDEYRRICIRHLDAKSQPSNFNIDGELAELRARMMSSDQSPNHPAPIQWPSQSNVNSQEPTHIQDWTYRSGQPETESLAANDSIVYWLNDCRYPKERAELIHFINEDFHEFIQLNQVWEGPYGEAHSLSRYYGLEHWTDLWEWTGEGATPLSHMSRSIDGTIWAMAHQGNESSHAKANIQQHIRIQVTGAKKNGSRNFTENEDSVELQVTSPPETKVENVSESKSVTWNFSWSGSFSLSNSSIDYQQQSKSEESKASSVAIQSSLSFDETSHQPLQETVSGYHDGYSVFWNKNGPRIDLSAGGEWLHQLNTEPSYAISAGQWRISLKPVPPLLFRNQ